MRMEEQKLLSFHRRRHIFLLCYVNICSKVLYCSILKLNASAKRQRAFSDTHEPQKCLESKKLLLLTDCFTPADFNEV